MIKTEKLKEVIEFAEREGNGEAVKHFNITHETLGRYFRLYRQKKTEETEVLHNPNILILDIETAPLSVYVFSLWKQNINLDFIRGDWFMLTWSAKWLNDSVMYSDKLTSKEALAEDDARICKSMWELLNLADIVIAHNGKRFDVPKLNTRFLINGLNPPTPFQIIDTLLVAKKVFGFSSNRLDQINRQLGLPRKIDTDASLWVRCKNGDAEALEEMETYNKGDVEILEQTYMKLRAWIPSHPNYNIYNTQTEMACAHCGSTSLHLEESSYATGVSRFPVYRCEVCGATVRSRHTEIGKKKRDILTLSMPAR